MEDSTARSIKRVVESPLFPFNSDLDLKALGPEMHTEVVREGEGDRACKSCGHDERVLWRNERWGDGSSHFHMWFQGRPAKQLELYGWGNVLWSQVLDPLPAEVIDANHELVVDHLRAHIDR